MDTAPPTDAPPVDAPPTDLPPLMDENMNFSEGYQGRVGEHATGSTFKSLPDLFKSQQEATTTIRTLNQEKAELSQKLEASGNFVPPVIPQSVADFSAALTLPEGADIPEGVAIPPEMVTAASEFAIKEGIPPEMVSKFIGFQMEQAGSQFQTEAASQQMAVQQATATITEAVGAQNYDATIANAAAASETLGLNISSADLAASPNMVIALANIKSQISAGALKGATLNDAGAAILSGSKLEQAGDIVSNTSNPLHAAFYDSTDTQHEVAVATHSRLISESERA
jgi:hypothetical protein